MKYWFFTLFFVFSTRLLLAQKDSLKIGDKYWEDQLYLNISYNVLQNQPSGTEDSGFSYSFSGGYIKDIPLNKRGDLAVGIGLGYGFSSFNHGLQVINDTTIELQNAITNNKITLHNLELPIQFRWRTSDAVTYAFWRVYTGIKITYNLSNTHSYTQNNQSIEFSNISFFNKFQTGLEISAGYGAFNLYGYYGFTPIYKDITIANENVNSKIIKFGLIFYLL